MSDVWGTSDLLPLSKVNFHWEIRNFPALLKSFGKLGFDSPEFKITSPDGKQHSMKLRFKQKYLGVGSGTLENITEAGVMKVVKDFTLIDVQMVNTAHIKFCLAATLDIDIGDAKNSGFVGDPSLEVFDNNSEWEFKNRKFVTYTIEYEDEDEEFTGFCVANATQNLQMKVQVTTPGLVSSSISLVPSGHNIKEISASRLATDIKSLLIKADEYADFSIVCQGKTFPCHEAILRTRSPVFEKMFQQKMKEATTREMFIEDIDKNTVGAMLEYLYTGELGTKVGNESELIYVADKYGLAGLLELCFHKLPEVEEDRVVDILILADRHNLADFKNVAMQRILMNKSKIAKNEDFIEKMKQTPLLLVELFQL